MLAFVIKACVAALKKYPAFNASLDAAGENLILKQYYNIGFAADTPNGLVVPVVKNADQKGVAQIAQEMGELSAQARDGKLKPADMQGASFTISSLGGIGGTAFHADHQCTGSGDSRPVQNQHEASLGRQAIRAAPDDADCRCRTIIA